MNEEIKISNPSKIIFLKNKIKKIDIIKYYIDVCKLILPYIKNRPLTVLRCHENINSDTFLKKHPTNEEDFVNVYKDKDEKYFYIDSEMQLIKQVQNGTIEFHINGALIDNLNKPNLMVFDLDPDINLPIKKLQDAVIYVKDLLDELKIKSFLKTSGGKGYHIVIPFSSCKDYDSFYEFSKKIALLLENKYPNIFTTNIKKDKRNNKIFIDYLRNNKKSTCIAPYSIKAKDNASISFPILYEDIYKIKPNKITIKNYKKYLNDAWADFYKIKQKIN